MQTQTVFRAGNSGVVSIPVDIQKSTGIKTGTKVVVEKTETNDILIRKSSKKSVQTPDFRIWWNEFLEGNSEILDELAIR